MPHAVPPGCWKFRPTGFPPPPSSPHLSSSLAACCRINFSPPRPPHSSMLAEALHSIADILNQFLLRIGVLKVRGRSMGSGGWRELYGCRRMEGG